MDIKVEKLPKSKIKIILELSSEEFSPYFDIASKKLSEEVEIPGFRKGKAPRKLVEEKVGKEKIMEEAVNIVLDEKFKEIIREKKLKIIGAPQAKVDFEKIKNNGSFFAQIEAFVLPEIKLADWKKITKEEERKEVKVEDKEIKDSLLWLQKSRAKKIRKFEKAEKGDEVLIDYEIRRGGVLVENGILTNQKLIIGENRLLPDFEKELIGMREGEEKSFSIVCPDNFWKKDLRGKPLDFKVKMKEIFKVELPELNDDFAKSLGKFENLEGLKKSIKEGILIEKEEEEERKWQAKVFDRIAKESEMEVPEILIFEQRDRMIDDLKNTIENEMGLSFNDYLSQLKKTEEELKEDFLKEAERRVRVYLCLYEIAEKENIKVGEEELKREIEAISNNYPQLFEDIRKTKSKEDFENFVKEKILEKKVLFLLRQTRDKGIANHIA